MIVSYIAYCNPYGEIVRMGFGKASNNPPEGVDSETGQTIVHITGELPVSRDQFVRTTIWDGESWVSRPDKPNRFAQWDGSEWTWDPEDLLEELRRERNVKLGECDWTRMDDNGLTELQREEWAVYRQALRDITKNYDSLDSVVWPDSP